MYKIIIIDDEPIIRKGIKSVINWEEIGCELCAEAGDGQKGRELIEQYRPDIIITDIKMPEVDGLTMIREIKALVPNSKVIILTGYRDFDYAYQAIKLDAFDFILKPTKIEHLHDVIRRAVDELKAQNNVDSEAQRLKKLYEKNLPFIKEKLLYNLLTGISGNFESMFAEGRQLGITIGQFQLVIVENETDSGDKQDEENTENSLYQFGITNAFEETFSDFCEVHSVSLNSRRTAFVLKPKASTGALPAKEIKSYCTSLQQMVRNCFGFTISIAVSSEGSDFTDLPVKFRECCEAFKHKFCLGCNSIIFFTEMDTLDKQSDDELYACRERLFERVKAGDAEAVSDCTDKIFGCINGMGVTDKEYIRKFYFDTITIINTIRTSALIAEDALTPQNAGEGNLYNMIEKCDNVADLNGLLESLARRAACKISDYNSNNMKLLLRKAVDYLNKHYSESVTLNQVASAIFVSSSYISRIFKKELGVNFVDYLNEIRINKAKDLLGDINYKTYEVADAVGIPNPHYFSKLFKKYTGRTPSEYKELLSKS